MLVACKGFVCRLCNCFLLDEQRVAIHCQTAAHYINYTTMTKMKEATSGGKKRSIDQVTEEEVVTKEEDGFVIKEEKNDGSATQETPIKTEVCFDFNHFNFWQFITNKFDNLGTCC